MTSAHATARELVAPERLGLETRVEFRKAAIEILDQLPDDTGQLIIDLARTRHVDSAGLGVLMLVQRRAAERRQTVVLRDPSDELRFLLVVTKLVDLFRLEPAREGRGSAPAMDGPGAHR
ncbi:MAG TPA: STAS domain-containing protein [Gemmatimonadales bacterium]|nr:STAS domain-containing protein [Gemmatimonadales bacterium]